MPCVDSYKAGSLATTLGRHYCSRRGRFAWTSLISHFIQWAIGYYPFCCEILG